MSSTKSDCIDHGCKGYGLGYATAWVWYNGKTRPTTKHRRVHFEATGEWPEVVRHTCDNPRCINPGHLLSGTYVDNMRDCMERGRQGDSRNFSTANGRCVLSDTQVQEIRQRYVRGNGMALAREFGVGRTQISRIVRGEQRVQDTA